MASCSTTYLSVIDNCENHGTITAQGNATEGEYCRCNPAGICAEAHGLAIMTNTANYGDIVIPDGIKVNWAAGLLLKYGATIVNCGNYGDITGYADKMAGFAIYEQNYFTGYPVSFVAIKNKGTLTNKNPDGETHHLLDGDRIDLSGMFFDSVDTLNTAISSTTAKSIYLNDITVANTEGTLEFGDNVTNVFSDKKVCSNVKLNNVANLSIEMPDTDITISDEHASTNLYTYLDKENSFTNPTVTIENTGKLYGLIIGGKDSKAVNKGTIIGGLNIYHQAIEATNETDASITGGVHFDAETRDGEDGTANKKFINKGSVSSTGHVISTYSNFTVNPTIENYGTILSNPAASATYMFLWYSSGNMTITNYENSILKTTQASGGMVALSSYGALFNINYKTGAKFMRNDDVQEWDSLKWDGHIIVTHI